MVCDLTLMADGRLGGSDGKAIKLYGPDAQLTAENLLPEHVPNMRLLIERVKVGHRPLPHPAAPSHRARRLTDPRAAPPRRTHAEPPPTPPTPPTSPPRARR